MVYLSALVALAVILGGGLSYEANKAPTGTLLYTYKIEVNERLEEFLAHTDETKAQLDLALLKERLHDARTLALQGKLDAQAQTATNNEITAHVKNVTATLGRLQAQGKYGDAATFAAQLFQTLHDENVKAVDVSTQGSTSIQLALAPILVKLRTTMATVSLISTQAQAQAAGIKVPNIPTATIGSTVDSKL